MAIFTEENLINLLYSFNPWWKTGSVSKHFDKPMKRTPYYDAVIKFQNDEVRRAVLLSGARRTGKTTIMYQVISSLLENSISPKDILFVSFDHPLLKMCTIDDVMGTFRRNISANDHVFLFFDEIQYSNEWNNWLKILYDTHPSVKVMATGSASPILEQKSKESGLGRWVTVEVPTLSFFEYCELLGVARVELRDDIKPTKLFLLGSDELVDFMNRLSFLQPHFIRYLQVGGFPELALSSDDIYAQRVLREDIVEKAIKRDLPSIYSVRNINDLEKVFLYLCYTSSNLINITAIAKELNGVSRITVEKYINYLKSANLIYISPLIDVSSKQVLKAQNKIYVSDASIRNAVLMKDDVTDDSNEMGIIVETAVYKHVRSFNYEKVVEVGYYRGGSKNKEIDIVVDYHRSEKPIMIEVKYREDSRLSEKDAIVEYSSNESPNIVITKKDNDYGKVQYSKGRCIFKIPAHVFLYLLGYIQDVKLKNWDNIHD